MLFMQVLTKLLHHHTSEMYVCVVFRAVCFALPVFLSPPAQLVELGFSQMLLGCCWAGLCWGFLQLNLPELLVAAKHGHVFKQPVYSLYRPYSSPLMLACLKLWIRQRLLASLVSSHDSVQEMVFSHGLCRKLDVAAQKNQLAAPICTDNVTSDG